MTKNNKTKYTLFSKKRLNLIKAAIVISGALILIFIELSFILDIDSKYYQHVIIAIIIMTAAFILSILGLLVNKRNILQRMIEESEKKYRNLTDYSMIGIIISIRNKIVFINPRIEDLTGYSKNELLGFPINNIIKEEDLEKYKTLFASNSDNNRLEFRLKTKNDKYIWCEMVSSRIDYDSEPAIMANIVDISEAKQRRQRLSVIHNISESLVKQTGEKQVYKIAINNSLEIFNCDAAIAFSCEYEYKTIESKLSNLKIEYQRGFPDSVTKEEIKPLQKSYGLFDLCLSGKGQIKKRNRCAGKKQYLSDNFKKYRSLLLNPIVFEGKTLGMLAFFSKESTKFVEEDLSILESISDQVAGAITRERLYKHIQYQSEHDPLTDLYNRRYLNQTAIKKLRKTYNSAFFLMIDIDRFKEVNDKFGHLEGDRVLRETSTIISNTIGKKDIVFRFGGDEFLIIMPGASEKDYKSVVENLQTEIQNWSHKQDNIDFEITLSIGKSRWHRDSEQTIEKVIQEADERMYKRKRQK
ncbi:MAG: diguanylate cyclase [Candidatus Zixiibacteriota bacterium]